MASTTFLNNVDKKEVDRILEETDGNTMYFSNIVNEVVSKYTQDLDDTMEFIQALLKKDTLLDDITLEKEVLILTNTLYFIGERLEIVGIKADVSKAAKQEKFNKAYLGNQEKDIERKNKTTVAENTAVAEEISKYEAVVTNIYERVYKIIKFKVDAAQEMINTLRKVITKHIQEISSTQYNNPKTDLIKEEVGF